MFPAEGARPALRSAIGRSVVLGVRPEAFTVSEAGGGDAALSGAIAFIEDLGATLLAHVDVEAADRLKTIAADTDEFVAFSHRLRVMLDGARRVRPGERLSLIPDPARIHVFDAATEKAIAN